MIPTPPPPSPASVDRLCPSCWLTFDVGDVLSVASHDSLRGDPVLGSEERLRFLPTRFDAHGHALDPMGIPTAELACPHCRRLLPGGFIEREHHILSLVGMPSSGKTYYLSSLIHELQEQLPTRYGLVFRDGDPTGNRLLNAMKTRLFSAREPEEAILAKTAFEGAMYERLPRHGKTVALPRPFVYSLSCPVAEPPLEHAFILYDNAGEHFEPGIDLRDSPGALHVAHSDGLMFLFDPTSSLGFRQALNDADDPQLKLAGRMDQQDVMMAEMEVRLKRLRGLPADQPVDTPLAVLVGKYDVWKNLSGAESITDPAPTGKLDQAILEANSRHTRALLARHAPAFLANAESLAKQILFFPVSALGHSPHLLTQGKEAGMLAPDPSRLKPYQVEIPFLWIISRIMPDTTPYLFNS